MCEAMHDKLGLCNRSPIIHNSCCPLRSLNFAFRFHTCGRTGRTTFFKLSVDVVTGTKGNVEVLCYLTVRESMPNLCQIIRHLRSLE